MARQTQDSLMIVGAIAGGITLVAFLAMMVIGGMSFSPAAFLALLVGLGAAIVLYNGFHEKVEVPKAAASAAHPAPAPAAAPQPAPASDPVSEPDPAPVAAPAPASVVGTAPAKLEAARDGKADDLKQIKGVGPKLEAMLNRMGFYHFDQIANWTDAEAAWVDENLEGFNGRVARDDWRGQAKDLAARNS